MENKKIMKNKKIMFFIFSYNVAISDVWDIIFTGRNGKSEGNHFFKRESVNIDTACFSLSGNLFKIFGHKYLKDYVP